MEWALSLAGMVLVTLVILYLAYWFTRHIAAGGLGKKTFGATGGNMRLLDQMAVGQDRRLLVVAVGERYFVLGSSPAGLQLIAELTEQEASRFTPPPQAADASSGGFGEILSRALGHRGEKK